MFISGLYACIYQIINTKSVTFLHNRHSTVMIGGGGVLCARQFSVHSGGCMNPSIAIGLNLCKFIFEGFGSLRYLHVYIIYPILGSFLGTLFFDYIYKPYKNMIKKVD
jgi:glycerol uptake facilitator-like aquaporin